MRERGVRGGDPPMADETRSVLHRALGDFAGGLRALLGLEPSDAKLVEQLLKDREGRRRRPDKGGAARGSTGRTLVRVK
jgi:hypothetical protein